MRLGLTLDIVCSSARAIGLALQRRRWHFAWMDERAPIEHEPSALCRTGHPITSPTGARERPHNDILMRACRWICPWSDSLDAARTGLTLFPGHWRAIERAFGIPWRTIRAWRHAYRAPPGAKLRQIGDTVASRARAGLDIAAELYRLADEADRRPKRRTGYRP